MKFQSFAKINLFLYVTGKREDGYHDIFSLMCRLKLSDLVTIDFNNSTNIEIKCSHPDVPEDNRNIAYKAAELFYKNSGIKDKIKITIEKEIPVGAGLGGGSSNAGYVLNHLNRHYNNLFSRNDLISMGTKIGADVPFFIFEEPAIAEGIGNILKPCKLVPYHVILINPGIDVSTSEIYKNVNLGLTKSGKKTKERLLWKNKCKTPFDINGNLWNDLESVTSKIYPEIDIMKKLLNSTNSDNVLMAGSGSTVFGLYLNKESAEKAFETLKSERDKNHDKYMGWKFFQTEMMV